MPCHFKLNFFPTLFSVAPSCSPQVTYKKVATNHLMGCIQLGIQHSLSAMARYDERDLLMQDFMTVETVSFPKQGSQTTPAHPYPYDFTCRTVAPLAFRYFLNLFGVRREDFMMSICNEAMRELREGRSEREKKPWPRRRSTDFVGS